MPFIRKHRKGSINYYSLVESQRLDGKVTQRQIEWLGDYDRACAALSQHVDESARAALLEKLAGMAEPNEIGKAAKRLAQNQERVIAEAEKFGLVVKKKNPLGSPSSDPEWYTPPYLIELARSVLGSIDLDPASNETAQGWIKAGQYFTKADDGLAQPWSGRLWCNPPYGSMGQKFLQKAVESYEAGQVTAAILLLGAGRSQWRRELFPRCTAICKLHGRISFIDGSGQPIKGNSKDSDIILVGGDVQKFEAAFGQHGDVEQVQC